MCQARRRAAGREDRPMGMPIPTTCDRCGAQLPPDHMRLRVDARVPRPQNTTRWVTGEFRRYYCPACAEDAKRAVRRFEGGGR